MKKNRLLNIINEEILILHKKNQLNESIFYTLADVAGIISRMGYDFDAILQLFKNAHYKGGDDAVEELYKDITKGESEIETMSRGRYDFKNYVTGSVDDTKNYNRKYNFEKYRK